MFSVTAEFVIWEVKPPAPLLPGPEGGTGDPGGAFNAAVDMTEVSAVVYMTNLSPETVS